MDNSFLTFLGHFRYVLYPYPSTKKVQFCPSPAQAVFPNLRPILLFNTTNMGYCIFGWTIHFWHCWVTLGTFGIRIRAQNGFILTQFLPKLKSPIYDQFCSVMRLIWGIFGWGCRLWRIWITLRTFCIRICSLYPKWLYFRPIPAQSSADFSSWFQLVILARKTADFSLFCWLENLLISACNLG